MTNSLDENKSTTSDKIPAIFDETAIATALEKEKEVFEVFTETLKYYKPHEVMLSYNGGKDCTILLNMLAKFFKSKFINHTRVPVLYIQSEDAFGEVEKFVEDTVKTYDVDLIIRKGSIKKALNQLCGELPHIRAVIMGSRRTDPFCGKLKIMEPTDEGWPPLMRISPIIDWTCRDVWAYIFANKVPYCSLYDQGYTSLGNKKNTEPNPHLKVYDENTGLVSYRPAYTLLDDNYERAGRN